MTIEKRLRFTNKQRAKITFEIFDFVQMTGTIRDIAPEWKLNRKQTFDFLKEVNYQHYMELVESKIETDCVYICVSVKKIDLGNRSFLTFDQGAIRFCPKLCRSFRIQEMQLVQILILTILWCRGMDG